MLTNSKLKSSKYADYFDTDRIIRPDLRKQAFKGTRLTLIAQVLNFGIQTGGTIILARLLTPHDFGLVTMVLAFSLLLQNFGFNGFVEAIIQRKEINHEQISTLFWINGCLSLLLMFLLIASTPIMVWFYKEPALKPIIPAIAISIGISGTSTQHLGLLMRNMEFFKTSTLEVAANLISIAIAILLAIGGWGYWALVAKWLALPLATAIGAWFFCRWRPGLPSRDAGVRPMVKFALNTYGNFIMSYFRKNMDKMIIGRFYGSQPLGYYDRAYHLSNLLPNQILNPLTNVAIAAFSRLAPDPEKYRLAYLAVLSVLAFVCLPFSAVLTLTGKDLIYIVLGPKWEQAGVIFCVFASSTGIAVLYITHSWLHLSLGTPDKWFRWGILAFIVTTLLFMAGVAFGAIGVAIGYSASFYMLILPALWYGGKPVKLRIKTILSATWRYFVAALAAGLLCWYLFYSYEPTSNMFLSMRVFPRIILSSASCVSIYLLMIMVFFGSVKPIVDFWFISREIFFKGSMEK